MALWNILFMLCCVAAVSACKNKPKDVPFPHGLPPPSCDYCSHKDCSHRVENKIDEIQSAVGDLSTQMQSFEDVKNEVTRLIELVEQNYQGCTRCVCPSGYSIGDDGRTCRDLPVQVGSWELGELRPGQLSLIPTKNKDNYYLSFGSFRKYESNVSDAILYTTPSDVSDNLKSGGHPVVRVADDISWPNEIKDVPDGIFGDKYVWSVTSGFFVPGLEDGGIFLFDMTDINNPKEPVDISSKTQPFEKWYYHRIVWFDMDGDGDLDALTARTFSFGIIEQILWFENPGSDEITSGWTSHVLAGNAGINFCMADLPNADGTTTPTIIAAGYWRYKPHKTMFGPIHSQMAGIVDEGLCVETNLDTHRKLTVTWSESGNWTDTPSINQITIDDPGFFFDVEYEDINNDGKKDLLTTTWKRDGYPGYLLVYEVPSGWKHENWTRHLISDNFYNPRKPGHGTPGIARRIFPREDAKHKKPHILVTGAESGKAFIFLPKSQNSDDWNYSQEPIYSPKDEIAMGRIAYEDVDNDGQLDLFIPSYELARIIVMSYRQRN